MHETRPAKITSPITTLNGGHIRTIPVALIVAAAGIGGSLLLSFGDLTRFMHTYLVSFCFVLSISVGCLFFVTIMHLTRAGWSVTLRRIAELYAMCALPLGLLFLPILIPMMWGSADVYPWNEVGYSIHSGDTSGISTRPPIEALKADFLNFNFFAVRVIAYFLIWGFMAWFYLRNSLNQDATGDKKFTNRSQAFSAPLLILFAVTVVFSSFDFEMSLSPLWFSTMFPVYYFAGAFLASICTILLTAMWLQRTGRVTDEITLDHYHDLGKLMQGFVIFWGYIAFSQFLLIWYANIPEETFWYRVRFEPGWAGLSLILLIGHLFIPFFLLMGRGLRRNKKVLAGSAIFLLVMHWVDHYWLIMPQVETDTLTSRFTMTGMGLVADLACLVGMIGVYIALFCLVTRDRALVPLKDPRLGEALNHEVH